MISIAKSTRYQPSAVPVGGRIFRAALLVLGLSAIPCVAPAAEGGGFGNFAVGAQTVGSGVLAPPGQTVFYGYLLYYSAGKFVGNDGRSLIPDFDLNVAVEASMIRHTWGLSLGGFDFASSMIQEAAYVDVEAAGQRDSGSGSALLNIVPIEIGRHMGNWHAMTAGHFIMPGSHDEDELANVTQNYYTYTQEVSVTWIPTPRWMLDLSSNYSFNRRNKQTDYTSGDILGLTWGAHYGPVASDPRWQVGLNGLYLRQTEDDKVNGNNVPVPGGFRIRKFNAGPQFGYWFSPGAAIVLKWQKEWDVQNGPKGDLFWIQAAFPI